MNNNIFNVIQLGTLIPSQFAFYVVIWGYFDCLRYPLKLYYAHGLLAPNRYELDLSNEVLNIHFGQGTAKISEVKVGGRKKKSAGSVGPRVQRIRIWSSWWFLLSVSNFDLWYFCSLLMYKSAQYLIWKIYFISVWSQRAKDVVWLLDVIQVGQSDPKTLHKMQIDPELMSPAVYLSYLSWATLGWPMRNS